jgi:sugar O-acyltransferase (sialic acid O-acetyltransferase NeuD family)
MTISSDEPARHRLAVVGMGGHGRVIRDGAASAGIWQEIVFFDDKLDIAHRIDALRQADPEEFAVVIGIGNTEVRVKLADEFASLGFALPAIVHANAVISRSAQIGAGTVVMAGAVINADSRVGRLCIVNTGATVDHDCILEDGVHIAPGVHLAGTVSVGSRTFVGVGAAVRNNIVIGSNVVVGVGAVVVKNIESNRKVMGNPAR